MTSDTQDSQPQELLARARAGDANAFGTLLEQYRAQLLSAADQGLARAAQAKAAPSDIVQETFLEAQRLFARFEGEHAEQFRAWLRSILDFKLKEHHNRYFATQKRDLDRERSLDQSDDAGKLRDVLPGDASTPSAQAMRQEEVQALMAAVERLSETYRQVLVWHHWEKLPFAEIGRRLDRSEDAARMLFGRALDRLAEELERPDARRPGDSA